MASGALTQAPRVVQANGPSGKNRAGIGTSLAAAPTPSRREAATWQRRCKEGEGCSVKPLPLPAGGFSSRLVFGMLYPAYASYKAVKTKNIREYVNVGMEQG